MRSIRILLVDDELDAMALMQGLLGKFEYVEVIGKASNKSDAIRKVIAEKPDVVFQDIQMHEVNGLQIVDEYRKLHYSGKIVFVTAFAEYAIDAIKKTAYDYMLKPVDPEELESLLLRLLADLEEEAIPENQFPKKLKISTRQGYSFLPMEEIIYCEADGNYTIVCRAKENSVTTSMNLGKIEKELEEPKFFRINRSVLINIDYLTALNKGEKMCVLQQDEKKYAFHISPKRIKMLESIL